jgi:hypothetical protein
MRKSVALLLLVSPAVAPCQASNPAPATAINWTAADKANVEWLAAHGRRVARSQVIVWAPADSIAESWQNALADTLDRGVAELRRLIGGILPWQRIGARPVTYYLSPGRFISHATGEDGVFIANMLVLAGRAPYLHEAAHELLAPKPPYWADEFSDTVVGRRLMNGYPLWLIEGFASVLAYTAASTAGVHEGDIFNVGGLEKMDATCVERVAANQWRDDILRVVGGRGRVEALFTTDRPKVAPTFYPCSESMSRFLVEAIGLERVVALFPLIPQETWPRAIERGAGVPLDSLQSRWRRKIGIL